MNLPKVFVARRIPQVGIDKLLTRFDVDLWQGELPPSRDDLLSRVKGSTCILSLLSDSIDAEVFDAAGGQLRGVANFAVGYNNIDIEAAIARGIAVGNTPDVLTDATADVAVGLVIAASRCFLQAILDVREDRWKTWEPLGLLGVELSSKVLGIVGMGRIGQAVARRLCGGWNMQLIYTSRSIKRDIDNQFRAKRVDFDELLHTADVISVHTDLNADTAHMFDANAFSKMKKNCVLVNTSRGGVIHQDALATALRTKQLFAAGLDVTDPEPLPMDSALRSLKNCLVLPHIGSATVDAREKMALIAADNLIACLDGNPMPHTVRTS